MEVNFFFILLFFVTIINTTFCKPLEKLDEKNVYKQTIRFDFQLERSPLDTFNEKLWYLRNTLDQDDGKGRRFHPQDPSTNSTTTKRWKKATKKTDAFVHSYIGSTINYIERKSNRTMQRYLEDVEFIKAHSSVEKAFLPNLLDNEGYRSDRKPSKKKQDDTTSKEDISGKQLAVSKNKSASEHALELVLMTMKKEKAATMKIEDTQENMKDLIGFGHAFDTLLVITQTTNGEMNDLSDYYNRLHAGFYNVHLNHLTTDMVPLTKLEEFIDIANEYLVQEGKAPICLSAIEAYGRVTVEREVYQSFSGFSAVLSFPTLCPNSSRLEVIEKNMDDLQSEISEHDEALDNVEDSVSKLEKDVESIDGTVNQINYIWILASVAAGLVLLALLGLVFFGWRHFKLHAKADQAITHFKNLKKKGLGL